jgi:serine/threonine protein kinase
MSSQIPGYQVIKKVGEGGMSSVYLAIQLSVGREVALKVLSPELRTDPTFAERFYREANIVGAMSHPNIISIYDVGQHGKHYYMAMDYLPGESCKQLIKKQLLTPLKSLKVIKEVSKGIEYVHEQGFIHCDIKPDNILFRKDGSAVITDFGIAKEINKEKSTTVSGTPHYMSPEQAQGQKLDKSSDIYSLGVMLFEMLHGYVPFRGKDAIAIAIKHVSAPLPEFSKELEEIEPLVKRMLAKKPGARFQNSNELIHAIDFYESQYLKQENTNLPLKLKLQFASQKLITRTKKLLRLSRQLQYSFKHGLILKMVDDEFHVPDVEAIAKTMDIAETQATGTLNTTGLTNDSIAMAIETNQAKKIVSSPVLHLFILFIMISLVFPLAGSLTIQYINQFSEPEVIYVD